MNRSSVSPGEYEKMARDGQDDVIEARYEVPGEYEKDGAVPAGTM